MNKLLLLIILGFCSITTFAQAPCGTQSDELHKKWWIERAAMLQARPDSVVDSLVYRIPVKFHVTANDSGQGFFLDENTYSLLCELNKHFDSLSVQFYLFDSINHISNGNYHNFMGGYAVGNQMMNQHNVQNVCNIYIVENPNGVCGYAYYPGSGPSNGLGGIALNKNCAGPGSTTLAHEVGHWLSLPHTFSKFRGVEFVNGTNCDTTGDLFCDTRADFLNYRWSCPYTGTQTDPNGDLYVPDETNFMSYSLDRCMTKFSNQQKVAMRLSITRDRPYLLTWPATTPNPMVALTRVSPIDSAINVPYNNVVFSWKKVPGASFYHVKATRFVVNAWPVNVFTTDTFLVVNSNAIQPNYWYRWKMKAYSLDNVCESYTQDFVFQTSYTSGFSQPLLTNINIYPSVLNKGELLNVVKDDLAYENKTILTFYGVDGKILLTHNAEINEKTTFNLDHLPRGLTVVHIQSNGSHLVKKIVLQ